MLVMESFGSDHLPKLHFFLDFSSLWCQLTSTNPTTKNWQLVLVDVGWHMASCKQEDFAKWHFWLFLCYILIFWAQKFCFIELNLLLSSAVVCSSARVDAEKNCNKWKWSESMIALLFWVYPVVHKKIFLNFFAEIYGVNLEILGYPWIFRISL